MVKNEEEKKEEKNEEKEKEKKNIARRPVFSLLLRNIMSLGWLA